MIPDRQLDLFDGPARWEASVPPALARGSRVVAAELDDASLIAAIPGAGLADCDGLAGEAVRRRIVSAVPALEALCRRFKGFGIDHAVPEQAAALRALAALGGTEARDAVARSIVERVVQGPSLIDAVRAAAALRCRLPDDVCRALLKHANPDVRANATCLASSRSDMIALLLDLLQDLNLAVARAAACALGRMGRAEARPLLIQMLREAPSPEAIEAASRIADETVIVMLGRIARARAELATWIAELLDESGHPRAAAVAAGLRVTVRTPPLGVGPLCDPRGLGEGSP